MTDKQVWRTGEIAAHCHVTSETVINWIKSGRLKAHTTLGGHRRIHLDDFQAFLRENNLQPLEKAAAKKSILVVDDDPAILAMITRFLRLEGQYEVAQAAHGFEAGLLISRLCPDLVILDLMMPQIDGFKVCQLIRSNPGTEHIKILVVTGYAFSENIEKVLQCGADQWLAKPFALDALKEHVDVLLDESSIEERGDDRTESTDTKSA